MSDQGEGVKVATWLVLVLLGCARLGWCQPPDVKVIPDKLTAEDPETLEPGQKEIEFFYFHSRSFATTDGHDRTSDFLSGSFSYGIEENLDFSLVSGANSILDLVAGGQRGNGIATGPARGGGLTNLDLQFRWKFAQDQEEDWALATVLETSIRNNYQFMDDDVKATGIFQTLDTSLVARKNWGRFTTNAEVFYSFPLPTHSQGRFSQLGTNLALGYQLDDWLQPSIELNYLHVSPLSQDYETLSGTAGFLIQPQENWTLYFGYPRTLAARNSDFYGSFLVGSSVSF